MIEHPTRLNLEQNVAFLERVFWHMVGVVNLVHQERSLEDGRLQKWQEIGTAAACAFRGAKLLLTAKHVVVGSEGKDLAFLVRPAGRIEWADELTRTRFGRTSLDIDRVVHCDWEDLAAIVLKPDSYDSTNIQFCQLPEKFADPGKSGTALLAGYPADQTGVAEVAFREDQRVHNLVAKSSAFWGEIVTSYRALSGFDPQNHFLMKFHPESDGGRPHGYSGGGIWVPNAEAQDTGVWTPDPLLMGIETLWYKDSQLLRAIGPEVIWRFLRENIM